MPQSAQHPRRTSKWWQRYRWYHLTAFLAGMNLFTVLASLALSHSLLNTYELSVKTDREWNHHVSSLEQLAEIIAAVKSPVDDALISRQPDRSRANLKLAVSRYLERTNRLRERIDNELEAPIAATLLLRLASVNREVEKMQTGAMTIFDLIAEGRDNAAGVELALIDQYQVRALNEIRSLSQVTRSHRATAIAERLAEANTLRYIELGVGGLVLLLVLAIVLNGARLARQMDEGEAKLARLSAIVEHSEDAILSKDLAGKITSWNHGAEQLYGYTESEVLGLLPDFLLPQDRSQEDDAIEQEVRNGHPVQQIETVRLHKKGYRIDVELTISPVRNKQGAVIGISQIARDIRELRASERAMQEATEASEAANRTKSEFLANMSHEIRTPMTAILGFTEILSSSVEKPEEIDAVETIRKNGEHLIQLINEILDLSKIEAGKLTLECVAVSIPKLVSEVIGLMRIKADAKGLNLRAEFPSPIPETISTDPTRLRQILINLLANSIKFTEVGLIRLVVRLKQDADQPPRLQFDVMDSGIGMSGPQITKLFQPFSQADSSMTRKFGGTGLGLSICYRLAQVLGGTITVISRLCVGTTFTVTIGTGNLDGVKLITPQERMEHVPPPRVPVPEMCSSARVLLAEDGPDNQRLIKYVLNKAGLEVTCCDNGVMAHDLALERLALGEPFDLILMDMQMPILDGYSATRQLRAMGYKRPIVALTAHAMSGDREKCMQAGCDDYVMKPIDRHLLIEIVSRHIALNSNLSNLVPHG